MWAKIIAKLYEKFTLWLMKGNAISVIYTSNNKYIVLMSEEEFKEWKDFIENVFIVYENEEQLKTDFPDAKPRETFVVGNELPPPNK